MALEIARVVAACRAASLSGPLPAHLRPSLDLSVETAVAALNKDRRPAQTFADAVTAALLNLEHQALVEASASQEDLAAATLAWFVSEGRRAEATRLATAHGTPQEAPKLAGFVAALNKDGFPAERMLDAVARFESFSHMGFVRVRARRISAGLPEHETAELVGMGWRGLWLALRSYDPAVAAFTTYAATKVDGAIRDGARAEGRLPKRLTTTLNAYRKATEDLTHDLGRPPTEAEIAARVSSHAEHLHLIPRILHAPASIEEMTSAGEEDRSYSPRWLVDATNVEDLVEARQRTDAVRAALAALSPEEAQLVAGVHLEERPRLAVRAQLGLTDTQFRALERSALHKLRGSLQAWSPEAVAA